MMAVVADMQVGHVAALWPEKFKINEQGNILELATHQNILLEYWRDFWNSREAKEAEYVLNLAESIEGNNRKEFGKCLMSPDIDIQCMASVKLIKPYIQGKKYFGLVGSKYHTSLDVNCEQHIAKELKGEFCGDIANLKIKKTGHVVWATHKGGDAMLYRSTMLDRNSLYFSAIKSKIEDDPDIIIYGHHHKCFRVDTETRINIIAPSWCFWHPIKGAAKFPYTQPTIGGLILKFPKRRGQIEVIKKFYPLEHIYSALCAV
jgi:hypothetical protein